MYIHLGKTHFAARVALDLLCVESLIRICRPSGRGKTHFLKENVIRPNIIAYRPTGIDIYIFDPKGSQALSCLSIDPAVTYIPLASDSDGEAALEAISSLEKTLLDVHHELRDSAIDLKDWLTRNPSTTLMRPRLIIIDESHHAFFDKKPSSPLETAKAALLHLVNQAIPNGRSAGMTTVLVSFSPTKAYIDLQTQASSCLLTGMLTEATTIAVHAAGLRSLVTDPRLDHKLFWAFVRGGEGWLFRLPFLESPLTPIWKQITRLFIGIFHK